MLVHFTETKLIQSTCAFRTWTLTSAPLLEFYLQWYLLLPVVAFHVCPHFLWNRLKYTDEGKKTHTHTHSVERNKPTSQREIESCDVVQFKPYFPSWLYSKDKGKKLNCTVEIEACGTKAWLRGGKLLHYIFILLTSFSKLWLYNFCFRISQRNWKYIFKFRLIALH